MYQRTDHSRGGNSKYCEAENDMGITSSVGMTNHTITSTATTYNHSRAPWVIWVSVADCFSQLMVGPPTA